MEAEWPRPLWGSVHDSPVGAADAETFSHNNVAQVDQAVFDALSEVRQLRQRKPPCTSISSIIKDPVQGKYVCPEQTPPLDKLSYLLILLVQDVREKVGKA